MSSGETMRHPMRDAILDAAERRVRASGYHGFSFREIAADVGIKSASVHYHFPTKADLALAVMERYRLSAMEILGEAPDAATALARMINVFRQAANGNAMCLCGALGASSASLPPEVQASATHFAAALTAWLRAAQASDAALPLPPEAIIALLEGALLIAVTGQDPAFFERAVAPLQAVSIGQGAKV